VDAGYDGWVGLEYVPSGASADSFGWLSSPAA
jgi:hydroxypyruvate isomerase